MPTERTTEGEGTPRNAPEPQPDGRAAPRGWSARDEPHEPAADRSRRSLWERFLYLAGIQGTDKRGGPGG